MATMRGQVFGSAFIFYKGPTDPTVQRAYDMKAAVDQVRHMVDSPDMPDPGVKKLTVGYLGAMYLPAKALNISPKQLGELVQNGVVLTAVLEFYYEPTTKLQVSRVVRQFIDGMAELPADMGGPEECIVRHEEDEDFGYWVTQDMRNKYVVNWKLGAA
jgi:hypothetical protein